MKLITCEFNMDSGCVELQFDDGTALDIDCTAVENKFGQTIRQRSELDWLIYNAPLEYSQLVLSGKIQILHGKLGKKGCKKSIEDF